MALNALLGDLLDTSSAVSPLDMLDDGQPGHLLHGTVLALGLAPQRLGLFLGEP